MPSSTNNELILIGGKDFRTENEAIASYIASKSDGEVGFVPLARADEDDVIERARALYAKHNCKVRPVRSVDDFEGLSLVYYAGGDSGLLKQRLKETGIHLELVKWWRKGEVILAGSSAGAMVMCGVMVEEKNELDFGRVGLTLTHGLGPIGSSFIVPHWSQWTTPEWRKQLIREHGEAYYIFGIDEATAMIWRAGKGRVIGAGKVHAFGRMEGEWGDGQEFEVTRGF